MDLSKFENKRILIVGDIMLDEFIYTSSNKNSPEYKDVPVLQADEKLQYLGGAANVALNIKKLKAIPYLVGSVGNDAASKTIFDLLDREEISNQYIFINNTQTTTKKSRIFLDNRPILRLDEENATKEYSPVTYDFLSKHVIDAINHHKPHAVILQDYNKGVLNPFLINEILSLAKQHSMLICIDPKYDNWQLYRDADLFKPNKKEFVHMSEGEQVSGMEHLAKKLQEKIHFKNLLVTLGSEGNFYSDGNHSAFNIQHSTLQDPDVCGAGDTAIAVATLGLASGFSLAEIAELSNKAGFIVCGKKHVQPIRLEEL